MAKRNNKCSVEKGKAESTSKKCKTPLKKQILEEISPDTIDCIARYFFAAGYEAGKKLEMSDKKKVKTIKQLLVKFREFISYFPDEVMT